MSIKIWIRAFRLRTLPLALSSIAMGSTLAAEAGYFRLDIFLLCVTTTVFLQILSNLANDYGDSIHGADHADRKGPSRTVQSGLISPAQMRLAVFLFAALCLCSGIFLLLLSFGLNWNALLFFFGLGVSSILAAIGYTVGKKPYGYIGLGDISVLIFFGLVGVMGSFYLFAQYITWVQIFPALSCGFFSMAVLNVNNIRDIESDRAAGKYSIPVRIGRRKATIYHHLLLISGFLSAVIYNLVTFHTGWQFLFLLSIPLLIMNARAVSRKPSHELDPYLKQMALSTLFFVFLFGAGLLL